MEESGKPRTNSSEQTRVAGITAILCFVAFIAEIVLLTIFLPRLRQYGSDVLTFGAYCTIGVTAAVMLFGILRSTGKLHGKKYGVVFEFGGPAALFMLLVWVGLRYELSVRPAADFSVPVYFFADGEPPQSINGKLVLYLDEPKMSSIEAGYSSPQRIPAKWNGQMVRYSTEIDGFVSDPSQPLLHLTPNEQQRVKLQRAKAGKTFSVNLRYDIRTGDGIPFGWMYSRENPKGVLAAPISLGQMHSQLALTESGFDDRVSGGLDGAPVASYLVLLTNLAKHPINVTSTSLVVRERRALPKRSVWIWNRKGRLKSEITEASLSATTTQIKLYPKNDEIAQLVEQDVLPLRLNLVHVEEGIYTMAIRAEAEYEGSPLAAESSLETLASPKDAVTSPDSMQILSHAPDPELGRALANLEPDQFSAITAAFENQLAKAEDVRAFVRNKLGIDLKSAAEIEDFFTQTIACSESGLEYLIASLGASESIPYVRKFLATYPDSDKVRFLEITCLFESGDKEAAKQRAAKLIEEDQQSSWGYDARWMIDGDLRDLETALCRTPDDENLIGESIEHWVLHDAGPTLPIIRRSFSRLGEDAQLEIAIAVLRRMQERYYGLEAGPACAQRLAEFSPIFSTIMAFMPEAMFWRIPKPDQATISAKVQNSVSMLLIQLGRFRLATRYASEWSRSDLIERTLWNAYDFASLHKIYASKDYQPKTADSYIFACLVALDREDFPLFDKLIADNHKTFHNQTNLVHFHYNVIKGNFEAAKQQLGYYLMQSDVFGMPRADHEIGDVEKNVMATYTATKWASHAAEKVASATKPYSAIPEFWKLCFGHNNSVFTEWPASFAFENRTAGRNVVWLVLSVLDNLGSDAKELEIVRMPLETCLVFDGKISDSSPTHRGKTLAECRGSIANGSLFFDRGVYGHRLTADQIEASQQFSLALYYYWNCGDAAEALRCVDKALKDDPNFYDALALKAASLACLGDLNRFEKVKRQIGAMNLPVPNFCAL